MNPKAIDTKRRKHKRTSLPITAKFRTYADLRSGKKSKWEMVLLRNISAGGALFLYNKEIAVGSLMDFVINIPEEKKPVECQAMVMSVKGSNLTQPFNLIAVHFTDMKDDAINSINQIAAAKET